MEFVVDNLAKFEDFRVRYPRFTYESYAWVREGSLLKLSFTYELAPGDVVTTTQTLHLPSDVSDEVIRAHEAYIFRIGLIEALSYWKAHCSPEFVVACGSLSRKELSWWKDTWYDGLGEFRYRNGLLSVSREDWVHIGLMQAAEEHVQHIPPQNTNASGNLIAFTGGKDSTLVLGLLRDLPNNETFFVSALAPERAKIKEVLGVSALPETLIDRTIHPRLLALNSEGALNGHTPFSVVVAFLGLFVASLRGKKYVIVANESSANQPTVPGTDINHQYSKSLYFEKGFQAYCAIAFPGGPTYFSLLRPLSEIGVMSMLKGFVETMPHISSCNSKTKNGLWCGACPKCLFVFLLASAVWDVSFAVQLFGVNMFDHAEYGEMLYELAGIAPTRPFECVGTTQEVLATLGLLYSKFPELKREPLLADFWTRHRETLLDASMFSLIACEFHEHMIPDPQFVELLKRAQDTTCYG